ncbi:hypothetical protein BAUCODRAFT_159892 [Baudoinia panamericana UAMH 10762]|uniref:C2H2-type domain-containing protein n=1 Tax=Baudoinia panamericana (strain UAMH 10762) TaxID=717646 RepID=M2M758_BAUPA|nr:uncharacterized protein BAUCODRAFT_159892 [Baudoinia panamericana UAMH 10762]EMC92136.1 hypothetical protein BAUCODRAFT_159892 [Baudoinia panamericana UAMH 10762]
MTTACYTTYQQYLNGIQYPTEPYQPTSPTLGPTSKHGVYYCLYLQCNGQGFSRYADLQRHTAVIHNPETLERIDCDYPGCLRRGNLGFSRKDKMIDHKREVHKVAIPKRVLTRK